MSPTLKDTQYKEEKNGSKFRKIKKNFFFARPRQLSKFTPKIIIKKMEDEKRTPGPYTPYSILTSPPLAQTRNTKVRIRKFNPRNLRTNSFIYVIGKRGTGKIPMIRHLLSESSLTHDISLAMASCSAHKRQFQEFIPTKYVFDSRESGLATLEQHISAARILDLSCMAFIHRIGTKIQRLPIQHDQKFTLFLSVSYPEYLDKNVLNSINYVFVAWESIVDNRQQLWKQFFKSLFQRFEDFQKVFKECTRNREFMVLDRAQIKSGVENCVFFYSMNAETSY
jgi:hypothetical protein